MDRVRLDEILTQFSQKTIVVFGDFFLDQYFMIDRSLDEISIETNKTAFQIVGKRPQPGAAGTVCNNLHALGIGNIVGLSVIGDDGEGYELLNALQKRNVTTDKIIATNKRFTPTYTKPMALVENGEEEMNRFDTKNRSPLDDDLEDQVIALFHQLINETDAIILADQVQERNCGILTDRVRTAIAETALQHPEVLIFADSRLRISEFKNVTIKPNRHEAIHSIHADYEGDSPTSLAIESANQLKTQTGKPIFLTLDKEGICPIDENEPVPIPCPPVTGPIDIVGAGDSTTAGIVSSLISGASHRESAVIGNLVASITIRQLGTTGTATPEQVFEVFEQNKELYQDF
jgi:rfaE bifunctional protein kinase chain/domain